MKDVDSNPVVTRYLTVDETAELLRVSRDTVFSLINSGKLPSLKVGKQFRISEAAIQSLSTKPSEEGEQA